LTRLGGREPEQVQHSLEQHWLSAARETKDLQTLLRGGYTLQMHYSFESSPEEILISMDGKKHLSVATCRACVGQQTIVIAGCEGIELG